MKLKYQYMVSGKLTNYVSSKSKNEIIQSGSFRNTVFKPYKIINIPELEKEIKERYKAENVIIMGFELINVRRRFS